MVDIAKFIEAKSDQLNAADLSGRELVIKIREVRYMPSKTEQPLEVFYEGDNNKPWRPGKAAGRILTYFWGTETDNWIGRSARLFNDTTVKFGGEATGGIRINALSHIKEREKVRVPISRGKGKDYTIDVLKVDKPRPVPAAAIVEMEDEAGLLNAAREAAGIGMASLQAFFGSLSKEEKLVIKPHLDQLKLDAAAADEAAAMGGEYD